MQALPVAPRVPVLGSLVHYTSDPLGFLERVATHGEMVEMRFPRTKFVFVREPRLVEQILQKQAGAMSKDQFLRSLKQRFLGNGLLTAEGDFWKRQRRLAQPSFHRDRVAGYGATMVEHTARAVDAWRDGERRDLHADMMHLTMGIVAKTLFGTDVGAASEVGPALEALMEHLANPAYVILPSLEKLPLPANVRFRRATAHLDAVVREIIRQRRAHEGPSTPDLLGMLLDARDDDDGGRMSDEQLRDEVLTIFMAGHETTALTLSYAAHLLATNPDVDAKLAAHLRDVLGDRLPTAEDMPRLTYAEHVVLEALRLYPPAWSIGRESIAEVSLEGRTFPACTQFWMSPWVMHRNAAVFPEPTRFRPERWADGLQKRLHRFEYFPFGGGPRVCIGNGFAMMEAVLLLTVMAQRFRFACDGDATLALFPSVTLRPKHGVPVRLHRRAAG